MGITANHISKWAEGHAVVDDVSLDIADGDFTVILGPTGAGKTTLLRMLCGVERPRAGSVLCDGDDVTTVPTRKRSVAMVYQQFVNYPSMTVYENIASPLRLKRPRLLRKDIDRTVRETAELVGLTSVLDHLPAEVSGGQQQRTAIARALAKGAKYFFLDEPLANLDFKLREELRGELKRIFQARGGAAIYATPDPIDALSMATHVGVMRDGRLLQYGPAREVYDAPANVQVAEYFSYPTMNMAEARVEKDASGPRLRLSDELSVPLTSENAPAGRERCRVGIRPHALRLADRANEASTFTALVEFSEVVGSDTEIFVSHGPHRFTALIDHVRQFNPGDSLRLTLDPTGIFMFDAESAELIGSTG